MIAANAPRYLARVLLLPDVCLLRPERQRWRVIVQADWMID
jgi:hypothetical protein